MVKEREFLASQKNLLRSLTMLLVVQVQRTDVGRLRRLEQSARRPVSARIRSKTHCLTQGQIALRRSTAPRLSSAGGCCVGHLKGMELQREKTQGISSLELRLVVGAKHLDNETN